MEDENELLDLVDDNDQVVSTIKRSLYYKQEKPVGYLRSTEMFIRNSQGQLWIPRRTAEKKIAPNCLDYSCGGHVTSGEDYLTSLIREAQEELNIDIPAESLVLLKKFSPEDKSPWFRTVYLYESDEVPDYNRLDFKDYYWLSPEELLAKLEAGEPAKSSMLKTIKAVMSQLI